MSAVGERQRRVRCPRDVEAVRLDEAERVTVGRTEEHDGGVTIAPLALDHRPRRRDGPRRHLHRRVEAKDLLDGEIESFGFGEQQLALLGMVKQGAHAVGELVGRRLVAGRHQEQGVGEQLVLGQRVTVVARRDHRRQQVIAGIGATAGHENTHERAHRNDGVPRLSGQRDVGSSGSEEPNELQRPSLELRQILIVDPQERTDDKSRERERHRGDEIAALARLPSERADESRRHIRDRGALATDDGRRERRL